MNTAKTWAVLLKRLSLDFGFVHFCYELKNGSSAFFNVSSEDEIWDDGYPPDDDGHRGWLFDELAVLYFGEQYPFKTSWHGVVNAEEAYNIVKEVLASQDQLDVELRENAMVIVYDKDDKEDLYYYHQMYEPIKKPDHLK